MFLRVREQFLLLLRQRYHGACCAQTLGSGGVIKILIVGAFAPMYKSFKRARLLFRVIAYYMIGSALHFALSTSALAYGPYDLKGFYISILSFLEDNDYCQHCTVCFSRIDINNIGVFASSISGLRRGDLQGTSEPKVQSKKAMLRAEGLLFDDGGKLTSPSSLLMAVSDFPAPTGI